MRHIFLNSKSCRNEKLGIYLSEKKEKDVVLAAILFVKFEGQGLYIWVISPGNVQLPINVVVSIILAFASLMSNIFLIRTPITIFDRCLA